jgi:large-conductance mechanosensitive channel
MNEVMTYILVWASPVQAVIAFLILAGAVFWLYEWAQHERRTRDTAKHIGEADPRRTPLPVR